MYKYKNSLIHVHALANALNLMLWCLKNSAENSTCMEDVGSWLGIIWNTNIMQDRNCDSWTMWYEKLQYIF